MPRPNWPKARKAAAQNSGETVPQTARMPEMAAFSSAVPISAFASVYASIVAESSSALIVIGQAIPSTARSPSAATYTAARATSPLGRQH